ncbi:MAG: hypothetical protein ACM34E_09345 [Acidobacteriota bacterium]
MTATGSAAFGDRLSRGLRQIAAYWQAQDGDREVFENFVRANFAADQGSLDALFDRFQRLLEQLDGHMHEIGREFRQQADLDLGPILPLDEISAGYDPGAHIADDFFENKLAFIVLLNFPLTTLDERITEGPKWTRREWAEVRLAQRFSKRIPAAVQLGIAHAAAEADTYISQYNIWMHHVVSDTGERLFPPRLRLLSHWSLRDEIKASYEDRRNGLAKQRVIQQIMERIITQTIPHVVIDNPAVDWNPFTNEVSPSAVSDSEAPKTARNAISSEPESDRRYAMLLKTFHASRKADPYSPTAPTLMARRFDEDREIPEAQAQAMLEKVVGSPLAARVGNLIQERLGRPLEPFDIWYNGFRQPSRYTEAQLDEIVSKRYPAPQSYQKDIPRLLLKLGFSAQRAQYLADHIVVDPARGAGHAMGAEMRTEKSHLRTRVDKTGMNYKSFNVAAHEMGHNVEQTLSLNDVDYHLLRGVPNTAFTEAFAFIFQGKDLHLLDMDVADPQADALKALNAFWGTYEISGVALVDMAVWHWMYTHPDARPSELKNAVADIAKTIWNRYYARVFDRQDVLLLGVYSHMIDAFLYLPDYPIGHMIAHQIEEQMKKAKSIGREFERMAVMGRVTPDVWMKHATGSPVGPEALLSATEKALTQVSAEVLR